MAVITLPYKYLERLTRTDRKTILEKVAADRLGRRTDRRGPRGRGILPGPPRSLLS